MFKKVLFLLVLTSTTFLLNAQTVDEILTSYFENTGGLDKWENLKSQQAEGTMYMQGMEFPGTMTTAAPNKLKMEFTIQGMTIVQAYDGETAWSINPFQTGPKPQKMPEEMAEEFVDQEFPSAYLDYKEKGHQIELEGKEDIEGTECFKLKVTKKSGTVEYHFFDTEYYIPVMVRTIAKSGPAKGQSTETFFSDYQEVDGLMIAHSIDSKMGGQTGMKISVSSIKINPDLDEDFFAFPVSAEMPVEKEVAAPVKGDKMKKEMKEKEMKMKKDKH